MWIENLINIENIKINNIPTTIISPKNYNTKMPVVFFYHGWSSSRDKHFNLGTLLGCNGYLVVIPDSINHGERGIIDHNDMQTGLAQFWPTVVNSLKEFPALLEYIKNNYDINENKIGVAGHSMGGMITSGILAHNPIVSAAVILNGSGAWADATLDLLGSHYEEQKEVIDKGLTELQPIIPLNNIEKFIDTPTLILHGENDKIVPIHSSKIFYDALKEKYNDKNLVSMVTFDRLNHYITEAMITEMINWFNHHLNN